MCSSDLVGGDAVHGIHALEAVGRHGRQGIHLAGVEELTTGVGLGHNAGKGVEHEELCGRPQKSRGRLGGGASCLRWFEAIGDGMQELVQAYYGQELQSSADLKTSACCDADAVPAWLKPLLGRLHPEVTERYYGCGLVCPPLLEGCRVLDLG